MKWLRKHLAYALAAILVAVGVFAAGGVINGFADETATSAPTVEKTLTPNGDGTYKLSLSVTGTASSESSSSKANVVIVFDTSGSMNEDTGQYTYTPTDETYNTYGLVEGKYVALSYHRGGLFSAGYWTVGRNGARYTGQRYVRTGGTRMEVAQSATTNLIDQLLANNTDENPDAVEISLVNFATDVKANGTTSWGNNDTNAAYLDGVVKGYTANGGTNWEAALARAETLVNQKKNSETEADEATYVIFVSDGDPTFRTSRYADNANDDDNLPNEGVWGTGNSDPNKWNFSAAKAVMDRLLNTSTVYAIGAFGNADNMKNIGGKYIRADNEADLKAAFTSILNQITNAVGFTKVSMTDNVTDLTASTLVDGHTSGFTYTKDGQPWTDAPAASFEGGKVSWNLGDQTLEKGVTYTVSFDVWPSQQSLDLLADLNNGTKTYDQLTPDQQKQIVAVDGGGYGLNTNTTDGNSVAYTQVETKTVNKASLKEEGYTWVDNGDGTWTGTKETPGKPINFTNPSPMPLTSSPMTIQKVFENSLDGTSADSINLMVKSDGNDYLSETLASAESWTKTLSIAPGIIKGNEVLEDGHDYTVTEPGDYRWDLAAPVYHPMIIDGTLTMLQEDANGSYTIAGKKYSAIVGTTLTATNSRRSNINLTKVVDDKTNGSAPTDAAFTYTGTVTDPDHADVWFSVMDAQGNLVKELTTSATAEEKDGAKTGYYHVASGTEFTVDLQAGQNLRIINAPKGMTYSFTESTDMPKGFAFEKAEGGDVQGQKVSGTVSASNTSYTATFTNSYDKVTLVSGVEDGLKATKAVTGHDATEAFSFELTAADDATKAAVKSGDVAMAGTTATTAADLKDGATQTVDFGDVTFYAEGTYKFTIDETTTTKAGGWTYDAATHEVTVTVTKVDGKLTATVAGNNPTFTNEYKASTTIETNAEGNAFLTKTVTADGTAWAPKTFDFEISAAEGTPMPEKTTGSATFDAAGTQVIDFGKVTYTKPGTYTYKVKETTKAPEGTTDGWTYDNAEKTVSVEVTDNNDGTLTAKVSGVTITNVYGANGELDSSATAVLTKTVVADGTAWAPKTFEFKISAAEGTPMPEKTTGSATFDAAGSQTVSFGKFSFTKAGTYKYKVQETTASGAGWTCDNAEHEVVITVKDNGDGTLTATVTTPASITNEYKPTTTIDSKAEGSAFLTKTVVADGTAWAPKTFDFQISAPEGTPMPASTTGSATFSEAGTKAVDFGTVTYTKAGTYTYTVTETTADGSGWDCDNEPKTVTVTVTDKGDGTLTATVTGATITNEYKPTTTIDTDAEASTFLTKTVVADGTAWADKTFDFTITAPEGTPMPSKTAGSATFSEAGAKAVDFGTVTYTKAGTYTYTVTETTADGSGWNCDNEPKTVTVTVTDKGDGTLVATVAGASITNTYSTTGTLDSSATAVLTKTVVADGTAWAPKTFEFSITQAEGSPAPESATGSATFSAAGTQVVSFGKFNFTKAGTYTYTVKETTESGAGWTCDNAEHEVVITVKDNGNGTLTAAVTTPASITNTYGDFQPLTVADPPVSKVVEGDPAVMPTFEFTMTGAEGAPMPEGSANGAKTVALQGAGSVEFGDITFTKPGTYTYTVAETKGGADGWTNDTQTYTVVYTVTDNGDGTLSVVRSIDGVEGAADSAVSFTNMYKDAPTTVDTDAEGSAFLTKAYDVADGLMPANKDFSFSITEVDADGNAVEGGYTNTGSADYAAGETSEAVDLGTITYDEPGTHYYKVTEATPDGGWTKSGDGYVVTVTVTDNGDGTLKAAVSGNGTITNTYKTTSTQLDASTGFAQKNVTSPNPTKDATFSFTLAGKDGAPMPANADGSDASSASVSYEAGESGTKNIDFGSITYTEPGTYSYTVTESTPASGWTATTSSANVNVTVKDNGDGTMSASVDTPATITNSYQAAATDSVTIKATKSLTGAPLMAGEFSFTLTGNNGAPMPSQTKAANVGDGSITFGPITYTEAGTYTYTVAEVNDGKSGFTYDTESKTVTVTVTDDGAGQLVAKVSGAPVFANSYVAESGKPLTLTAKKVLEGRALKEDQFSFQLFDESGNAVGEPVANDASGSITFPELNYTQQDFEGNGVEAGDNGTRTKTVTYTAKEVVPDEKAAGYTYSDNVAKYTVKLVDDGAGNITATLESSDSTTFTNTYKASPVTAEAFKATKELTGRTINAGEFKFQLTDEAGNVVEPVSNAADGTVTFSPITYKLSDLNNAESKTFKYTISEVGNDLGGVTYDTAKHTVSVTVTDNGDGTLTASKPVYDGNSETAPTFTNTYQAAPEVVPLPTVTKTVAGDQTDTYPTFSFVIEAQDGAPSLDNADGSSVTKTLDGPGSVDFGSVTFSAAGKYTYKIYEVAGDSDGWTYDGNVYTLTYTVTDNGNGRFDAVPTITNSNGETVDAVSFENTYTKPVVPEPAKPAPKVPDTGDTTSTALPVGLACIAVVAIAAGFIIKRKSNGSK